MAKAKKTKVVDSCCPTPCDTYKPRLYLNLQDKDVAQVKGLTIGEEVELVIRGKVVGISQRSRKDYDDPEKTVKTGDIDLEDYTVEVMGEEDNEFKELAEDD